MATNQITTNPNSANAAYFIALANLRREAAREVMRLLDFLDRIDGDWDLENSGDEHEPTLCHWHAVSSKQDGELEPSLGWTKSGHLGEGDLTAYGAFFGCDRELDEVDKEDNGDLEPWLGSTVHAAYAGCTDDREREEGL